MEATEFRTMALDYIQEHHVPKSILNIGIHGSAMGQVRPHSDVDLYCILSEIEPSAFDFLNGFMEHLCANADNWVDLMLGYLENANTSFHMNQFCIVTLQNRHVPLYGDNLWDNLEKMKENALGVPIEVCALEEFASAGRKLRKVLTDMNKWQIMSIKPAFDVGFVECCSNQAIEAKAVSAAKQILTACAFAIVIKQIKSNGGGFKFSKATAPELFERKFGVISELPRLAHEIYYNDSRGIDLNNFIEYCFEWFGIQNDVEKELLKII